MTTRLMPGTAEWRDLNCICCDTRLYHQPVLGLPLEPLVPVHLISVHHRILGNRADRRLSNLVLLAGSGSVGCHWKWHVDQRPEAERLGYIIRHGQDMDPTTRPVYYNQPSLGRVGWYLLDDHGSVHACEAPDG